MGSIRHPNLWPPFTQMASAANSQRVVSGDGALLIREQGEPLIDAISSWWVTLPVSYTHLTLPTIYSV